MGRRIQHLREAAGLSQAQLAEKAGMSKFTLMRWEQGRYDLGLSALFRLAGVLGVEPHELLVPAPEDWVPEHRRTGRPPRGRKADQGSGEAT